jgi:hypothetical protein
MTIGTIVVPTLIKLKQLVNLIPSIGLNLIEHVYVLVEPIFSLHVIFAIHVELVSIHVQISIALDTFK